jgi:hypothetical protein
MKKILNILAIVLLPIISISTANAEEKGGYAVVNPETGVVHGVIVATSSDPFNNGGTMPMEYMGCPNGCLIVQQSTADQNGNIAGIHGPNVTYNQDTNVFQMAEPNVNNFEIITESISNVNIVETTIKTTESVQIREFGVQDFRNNDGRFQLIEAESPQNTNVEISVITKEFVCEESNLLCSSINSNLSNTLVDESILFNERSTAVEIETKIIAEAKNKIREQLSLILSMLERWILN